MQYQFIDFSEYNLSIRIEKLKLIKDYNKATRINNQKMNQFKLAILTQHIIEATHGQIMKQHFLRNVIKH